MNSKLTFKKTPLALAIAGLVLSMGVQADSPFQFGRWAGGGNGSSSGSDGCTADVGVRASIGAGACNQDETLVQRTVDSNPLELDMVMYAAAEGSREEEVEVYTGRGTMSLNGFDENFEGEGTASFSLNPEDFDGDGSGEYSGPAEFFGDGFETSSETGGAGGFQLTGSNTSFGGLWALDGLTEEDFGFFVAGVPTTFEDLGVLAAENIIGYYQGESSPFTDFDVEMTVDFTNALWSGYWSDGFGPITAFGAEGGFNNDADFEADFFTSVAIFGEADCCIEEGSFVEGTLFGPGAEALGGHFYVGAEGFSTADVFTATLCDDCD